MQYITLQSKHNTNRYILEYDDKSNDNIYNLTSVQTGKTLKCHVSRYVNDKKTRFTKKDLRSLLHVILFRDDVEDVNDRNVSVYYDIFDISNKKPKNITTPTMGKIVEKETNMATTSFFKSAQESINNNPFKDMQKVKATDLLTRYNQVTVTYFDKYVGSDGKASYRCKIAEDNRIYFYAVTDLKRLLTTALSQGATVEQLNAELPLKFNITPTVTEYEGKQYNSIQFDLVEQIPVVQ